jgi:hypothetical protein
VDELRKLYARMLELTDYAKSVEDAELTELIRELDVPAPGSGFAVLDVPLQNSDHETASRHTRW